MPDDASCLVITTGDFGGPEICKFDQATKTVTITGVFVNSDGYQGEITVKLIDLINPQDNRKFEAFDLRTYSDPDATLIIDQAPGDMLVPRLDCEFPCKTCVGSDNAEDRRQCTSCWTFPSSEYKYFMPTFDDAGEQLDHGQCKEICDVGFSRDGKPDYRCKKCALQCSKCEEMDLNYCLECAADFPFKVENTGTCLEVCKDGFYQSSD